jgi:hypothetical protein
MQLMRDMSYTISYENYRSEPNVLTEDDYFSLYKRFRVNERYISDELDLG